MPKSKKDGRGIKSEIEKEVPFDKVARRLLETPPKPRKSKKKKDKKAKPR